MYETLTYSGGIHKSNEMRELIEDLGGFIIQENVIQMDLVLNMAVPVDDVDKIKEKSKELLGKLTFAPMAGSEIAIVSPTLARHHLPHAACDISEYLRRFGAKDNMIGLARGHGKGTSGISQEEKYLIEEHDLAIFALGSFKDCIIEKSFLFDDIDIPVIVTGAPDIDIEELPGADAYVGGLGRIPRRLKRGENIRALRRLVQTTEDILNRKKKYMAEDAPLAPPVMVKNAIERQLPEIKDVHTPTPITTQLDGLRVKLDYDKYHDKIGQVVVNDQYLSDIADINRSHMYNYTLVKLYSESSIVDN
ncbi:MAG: methanogenesis marker 7 protein [Methanobrevibacter boviskoreani]|uniref:methanogenesis marker 7 protein n=3 Tax=Methanobacteriaceae TaxID=2159 RepID=UPI00033484C1|nr:MULTISPECIES: methanogenesis marker 7 protein [Methanobrevibacter]AGN17402.1 methanogenesis marker protein 7 [Methanobrevibacter sp. AbM4]MCI6775304.1 methanogenesis marker 7 protein [Methanobrevibacter boviskoreani]MCI6931240.1 methanogenesis marker 7 protein [Methanobrevibacter boviskoreani]MDD6256796.1 methanogenesis marker 7 protein [Methanobrevibacter boviskoreani]MDY5615045.1 methanogenesis marker 7 protein [Methanobrevibacter boviskoreani]